MFFSYVFSCTHICTARMWVCTHSHTHTFTKVEWFKLKKTEKKQSFFFFACFLWIIMLQCKGFAYRIPKKGNSDNPKGCSETVYYINFRVTLLQSIRCIYTCWTNWTMWTWNFVTFNVPVLYFSPGHWFWGWLREYEAVKFSRKDGHRDIGSLLDQ